MSTLTVVQPADTLLPEWDDEASDRRTVMCLTSMILLLDPKVIVEAGTYRGHFCLFTAEMMRLNGLTGHIWTTDIADLDVTSRLKLNGLDDRVTVSTEGYDAFLDTFTEPIDFAYIDASFRGDPAMRVRHVQRTFDHLAPGGLIAIDDTAAAKGDWLGVEFLRHAARLHLTGARGLSFFQGPR